MFVAPKRALRGLRSASRRALFRRFFKHMRRNAARMRSAAAPPTAMPVIAPRSRILWAFLAARAAAVTGATICT